MIFTVFGLLVLSFSLSNCGGGGGEGGDNSPTYSLSGTVTLNGTAYEGAAINLSGPSSGSTTTDSNGEYTFTGLEDGSYTVTPAIAGQACTPANLSPVVSGTNSTGNNFAVDIFTLSGQVTLNSSGYNGAVITLSGSYSDTTSTGGSGDYSFTGLLNGTYTVTPSVSGQTLTPSSLSPAIAGTDAAGNNFAFETYSISGQVTHDSSGRSGVTVALSGAATASTTTGGTGAYSFGGLVNGNYTVTPQLYDQSFSPANTVIAIPNSSVPDVDFSIPYIIWYVDGNSSSGSPDGLSWGTAFTHPQNGADLAGSGDQVWVAQNTYASMDTSDPTMPVLAMADGVLFYGGFNGGASSLSDRYPDTRQTILDGSNFTDHVIIGADNARLDGFFVQGGDASSSNGAGMLNDGVTGLIVNNAIFRRNMVADCGTIGSSVCGNGAGMANVNGADVQVINSIFDSNTALGYGGAAYADSSTAQFENSLFYDNQALSGGGLANLQASGQLTVKNCTLTINAVAGSGGAIYNDGGSLTVSNTIAWGNTPNEIINVNSGTVTVSYSNVQGGYAGSNLDVNPEFRSRNSSYIDYSLDFFSPLIDAGNPSEVLGSVTTGLGGNPRIMDGDDYSIAAIDMGAYEYSYLPNPFLIQSLGVIFADWNTNTNTAGAFIFTTNVNKIFIEYGGVVSDGQGGFKELPTFEYIVSEDAVVTAIADGTVTWVSWQGGPTGYSPEDWEIGVESDSDPPFQVYYDHIVSIAGTGEANPPFIEGDTISVGDTIGYPGEYYRAGMGRTEIMINNGYLGKSYCPFVLFDPALTDTYQQQVTQHMGDWEDYKLDDTLYDETNHLYPGCRYLTGGM